MAEEQLPGKLGAIQREASALRLKLAGVGYDDIAKTLKYHDRSGAYKAVKRALLRRASEAAEEMREIENQRYDAFQVPLWQPAVSGDREAIRVSLLVSKSRRELFGLDKPGKLALTNPEGTEQYDGGLSNEQRIARLVAIVRLLEAEGAAGLAGGEGTAEGESQESGA